MLPTGASRALLGALLLPALLVVARADQTATAPLGSTVRISVTADGTQPFTYQWFKNGSPIPGATPAVLTLSNLQAADAGAYTVEVRNSAGSTLSDVARIIIGTPRAVAPANVTLGSGGLLVLSAAPDPDPRATYQWRRNGADLPGATAATLVKENVEPGEYLVMVSNAAGPMQSAAAVVSVSNGSGRLANLSSRGFVGTGENVLIAGFAVPDNASKRLLIRSAGPSLAAFGVTGTLNDPELAIYRSPSGQLVQRNDDWGSDAANTPAVRSAAAQVGAFALGENSKDAALVALLPSGAYTVQTTGVGGATGVALAEVYDLDTPSGSRLTNLSIRNLVGTGDAILIAGFVVTGTIAKTVLIRAIGPGLESFGVSGVLARPELTVWDGARRQVAANVVWESTGISGEIIKWTAQAGAFALPRGSADCVLLLTLPPGGYTAQVRGTGGSTGVALAEVYELP